MDDSIARRYDFPVFADLVSELRVKMTRLSQCFSNNFEYALDRWPQQFTLPIFGERHVVEESEDVFVGGQHVPEVKLEFTLHTE